MNQLFSRCTAKGFKPDDIEKCLEEYERLDVWQLNQAKTKLTIVNWVKNEWYENQVQHDVFNLAHCPGQFYSVNTNCPTNVNPVYDDFIV